MAILHSCCFWKSVRKGSYATAIYTLVYFGSSCVIVSIYLHDEHKYLSGEADRPSGESFLEKEAISPTTVIFNILLLICASCGMISCLLLIVGLRTDRREFLLPWIICMLADLIIEASHFIYLIIIETLDFEPLTATLFTVDFFIMCVNVYSLLCVISQYQEYKAGRGHAIQDSRLGSARYTPPAPTTTCLNTYRQTQATTSPLMYPRTNFSVVPEETPTNGKPCEIAVKPQQHFSILPGRRVQFPDDKEPMFYKDSTTRILTESSSNGRMLIDNPEENEGIPASWENQHLRQYQHVLGDDKQDID